MPDDLAVQMPGPQGRPPGPADRHGRVPQVRGRRRHRLARRPGGRERPPDRRRHHRQGPPPGRRRVDLRLEPVQGDGHRRGRGQGALRRRGRRRSSTSWPSGATPRTTSPAFRASARRRPSPSSGNSARSTTCWRASTRSRTPGSGRRSPRTGTCSSSAGASSPCAATCRSSSTSTAIVVQEPDEKETVRLFGELEFSTLLTDFLKPARPAGKDFRTVFDEKELRALAARIAAAGRWPSTPRRPPRPRPGPGSSGCRSRSSPARRSMSRSATITSGAPAQIPKERALDILRPVLEDPKVLKTGQNIKYDLIVLEREGVRLAGHRPGHDGPVLPSRAELGQARPRQAGPPLSPGDQDALRGRRRQGQERADHGQGGRRAAAPYACQDAAFALELGGILWDKVRAREARPALRGDREAAHRRSWPRWRSWASGSTPRSSRPCPRSSKGELGRLEKEIHGAGRRRLQHQLAPPAGRHPLPQARPAGRPPDQGHQGLLDVDRHPRGAGPSSIRWPGTSSTTGRCPSSSPPTPTPCPQLIDPETGPHPHLLQPDRGLDGAAVLERAQPPEHPRPGAVGDALPPGLHPGQGARPPGRRLFPDRAPRPGPSLGGPDPRSRPSSRTGTSTRRRPGSSSARPPARTPGAGPRSSTSASSTAPRPSPWPASWGRPRARPRSSSTATSPSGRRSGSTSTGSSRRPGSGAIPRRSSAGSARSPSCARPDRNLQQAGRRIALNNPIQGSAADIIKMAMLRAAGRARTAEARGRG